MKHTPLTDQEIKALGYQIQKEDTLFMKNNRLDIEKLERIGHTNNSTTPPNYRYEAIIADDTTIAIYGNRESGYNKKITSKKDFFTYIYIYMPSGKLKQHNIIYPDFFKKGIWYWYDESGTIKKYENHDAPYTFTWEDVLQSLEDKNIEKQDVKQVYRSNISGECTWSVFYKPEEFLKTDNFKVLILDGKTGKVIDEQIAERPIYLD